MDDFQKQCVRFIHQFVRRRLLDETGRELSAEASDLLTAKPKWMERGIGLAAALLASPQWAMPSPDTEDSARVFADGPRATTVEKTQADGHATKTQALGETLILRDYAERVSDLFARELIERCSGPTFPPNFEMLTLVPMIELLLPRASARQRTLWLRVADVCARVSRAFLLKKEAAWGRPGPYTGCGPNHLFIVAAPLFRLGRLLGQPEYCRLARRAIHKLCDLQTEGGYFPEDTGPAVNYHRVNLFGLYDYHATSGDPFVKPAIDRALGFLLRAMYPNLAPIETIDQRNRSALRIGQPERHAQVWQACFSSDPASRLLGDQTIAALQEQLDRDAAAVPVFVPGLVALAALLHTDGPRAKVLPCQRPTFVARFDDKAGIVRRDGWMVALSGYFQSNRPGNPFILDRTSNLSVFHDRFGLILGGGNDKNRFDAATIELIESGYVHYFPPIGGSATVGGRQGRVQLQYGPAVGQIQATIRSPRVVELLAGARTTFSDQVNWLNLQVPVGPGATVRIDGQRVKLSEKAADIESHPVKKWFEPIDGVRIELPGGGEFRWPVLPWNSYNIPAHTSPITAATGYLRLTLTGQKLDERVVRIRVG